LVTNLQVSYRGFPPLTLGEDLNFKVRNTSKGYLVRLIGISLPEFEVFNESYRIVTEPVNYSSRYLGNWTYILPKSNRKKKDGAELVVQYPIAQLYLVGDGERIFIGYAYFPYAELTR
jgi:hypothetical protein